MNICDIQAQFLSNNVDMRTIATGPPFSLSYTNFQPTPHPKYLNHHTVHCHETEIAD
jgi:hypothetical protein